MKISSSQPFVPPSSTSAGGSVSKSTAPAQDAVSTLKARHDATRDTFEPARHDTAMQKHDANMQKHDANMQKHDANMQRHDPVMQRG